MIYSKESYKKGGRPVAYTTNQAIVTLNRYLGINESQKKYIENTKERGFVLTINTEKVVIFVYPLVHKQDNTKNYFDTRDSGAYERGVTWNYSITHKMKYFCIGVNDSVDKYVDYAFSLECSEQVIETISGTLNGVRNGSGNQIIIPNDYIPQKSFERIVNKLGIYISSIHRNNLMEYLKIYDNRPYMVKAETVDLSNLGCEEETNQDENQMEDVDYTAVLNHNLYGIHIKENTDALSDESPHICIGWSALGDLSRVDNKEKLAEIYDTCFQKNNRGRGQDIGQIWRFLNDVKIGDYIIYVDYEFFHIGRVESDYYYDDNDNPAQSSDYTNNRKVTWIKKNLNRSMLSANFHNSLNTAMSIWSLNDYRSAVIDLLNGTYVNDEGTDIDEDCKRLVFNNKYERNRILFGAPGTGKSYTLNNDKDDLLGKGGEYERVTFHPDYSYANFVGTYKPVPCKDDDGKDAITYEYVPGPFMRIYVQALRNSRTEDIKPYLLLIEEINRANVAAVFGDVFQLLDRDNNVSEYPIRPTEDIKKYLAKSENLGGKPEDYYEIKIPYNMFIWATMNSADQGVFPMDTAFKRRWDFKYLGIDDNDENLEGKTVILGTVVSQKVEWNKLRKAINKFLANQKINEDKQLGPYFIAKRIVVPENGNEIDSKEFIETFKNKVIMYLFEDAAKQKRATLFEGCFQNSSRYSEICKEFEEKGIGIFNSEIQMAAEPEDIQNHNAYSESVAEVNNA